MPVPSVSDFYRVIYETDNERRTLQKSYWEPSCHNSQPTLQAFEFRRQEDCTHETHENMAIEADLMVKSLWTQAALLFPFYAWSYQ